MSDTLILYLLTRLDGLKSAFDFAVFVSGFGVLLFVVSAIVCFGPGADDKDLDRARAGLPRLIKVALTALVSVSVLNIATPTKNDVLFIIGGSALLDMAKSDRAKSIGDKTLSAVETWLDQYLPKEPGQLKRCCGGFSSGPPQGSRPSCSYAVMSTAFRGMTMIDFDPNETFPNVDQGTLDALIEGLSLLKTDPTAAAVYLDRALRDFGEDGFCNGKLL